MPTGSGSEVHTDDEIEATDEYLSYKDVSVVDSDGLSMKTCTNNQDHVTPIKLLFYLFPMFFVINMMLLSVRLIV